jgi:hypothetical protein
MALGVQINTREDFTFAAYGQFFLWPLASPLVNRNRLTEQVQGWLQSKHVGCTSNHQWKRPNIHVPV